jgi:NAD(P)-dependent dehydrogenase (short-subunit alcohol dehydrogenase family)
LLPNPRAPAGILFTTMTKQLFSLAQKTAVVTGAGGVLGSVMAYALAQAGASVALLGRREETLRRVVAQIENSGGRVLAVPTDVLDHEQLKKSLIAIHKHFGDIDILVNAAGGNLKGAAVAPEKSILDIEPQAFRQVVDLNLTGTLLPIQVFAPDMIRKRAGCIINISSMAAYRPLTRVAGYASAKAAISNLTQWLAVELATKYGEGIRVNAIAPGFFLTEQNRELLTQADGTLTERGQQIIAHTPFRRFGVPEELVGTLLWLCSDASKFVTGTIIPVDGGFNAYAGV